MEWLISGRCYSEPCMTVTHGILLLCITPVDETNDSLTLQDGPQPVSGYLISMPSFTISLSSQRQLWALRHSLYGVGVQMNRGHNVIGYNAIRR